MITLEALQLYAAERIPRQVLDMPTPAFEAFFEREFDMMLMSLRSHVWARDAGPQQTESQYITRKVKPRWIPQWLWNKIPQEEYKATFSIQPKFTYPTFEREIGKFGMTVIDINPTPYWKTSDYRADL